MTGNKFVAFSLLVAFALVYGLYFGWFGGFKFGHLSSQAESWGQFGDFVGGVLNPIVAVCAYWMLSKSVSIQKAELSETRKALSDSAESQRNSVKVLERQLRLSVQLEILKAKIVHMNAARNELDFYVRQSDKVDNCLVSFDGKKIDISIFYEMRESARNKLETQKGEYEAQLQKLNVDLKD